jgi:hypothetical protein
MWRDEGSCLKQTSPMESRFRWSTDNIGSYREETPFRRRSRSFTMPSSFRSNNFVTYLGSIVFRSVETRHTGEYGTLNGS